jgi:hypothetical protein
VLSGRGLCDGLVTPPECDVSGRDRQAAYASVVYVYSSCTTCLSIRLEYNSRFVGLGGLGCEEQ